MNTNSNTNLGTIVSAEEWWHQHGSVPSGRQARDEESTKSSAQPNGGWTPVFLGGQDWAMRSIPHGYGSMRELLAHEDGAALVILRDDGSRVWNLHGIGGHAAFWRHYGLTVSMPKGIGPLMKRLSRLLVEFRTASWLVGSAIKVGWLNHGAVRSKAYDASAKVTRPYVRGVAQLRYERDYEPYIREYRKWLAAERPQIVVGPQQVLPARRLPAELRDQLRDELERLEMQAAELYREAETILEGEFTFLLGKDSGHEETGLFKGQAMVVEHAWYDILLPRGAAKPEIALSGDRAYFGIKSITAHDHWYMDRQSLTNLNTTAHPDGQGFFSYDPAHPGQDRLLVWLKARLDSYRAKVENGEFNATVSKHAHHLAWESDAQSFLGYFLHRYIAMGGDVRWFRRTLSQAYQLGLDPIQKRFEDTSYPVPGLRLYVRPGTIAGLHLKRGQVAWNLERGVIYVNDVDAVTFDKRFKSVWQLEQWLATGHTLDELEPGLMATLGGYDNDDAMNTVPFRDVAHGLRKRVMLSRSPNMPGERWILEYVSGEVPEDGDYWFEADSRRLKDFVKPTIDEEYKIKPYPGLAPTEYSLDSVNAIARKMVKSRAAVGMYCLMVRELILICGDLPPTVPAKAEQVIDACSKNFEDVSGVIQWTRDIALALVEAGVKVPELVYDEFVRFLPEESALPEKCAPLTHWIDVLTAGAQAIIDDYKTQTKLAANLARPPEALFEHGLGWAAAGRSLRAIYGKTLFNLLKQQSPIDDPEAAEEDEDNESPIETGPQTAIQAAYELARQASESYLEQFSDTERPMVCVGGLAEVYLEAASMGGQVLGDDDEPFMIHDSAFFQLGEKLAIGREPGIDLLTLEGLAEIGILHDVVFENHRLIVETARIVTPLAKITAVHIAHGWFNLGIAMGRIKPEARMAGLDKMLIVELKGKFAHMDLRGKHFKPEMRRISIGPRMAEKPVLISKGTGNVLGIVHGATDVSHLPAMCRIVSAVHSPDGDNSWFMMASD